MAEVLPEQNKHLLFKFHPVFFGLLAWFIGLGLQLLLNEILISNLVDAVTLFDARKIRARIPVDSVIVSKLNIKVGGSFLCFYFNFLHFIIHYLNCMLYFLCGLESGGIGLVAKREVRAETGALGSKEAMLLHQDFDGFHLLNGLLQHNLDGNCWVSQVVDHHVHQFLLLGELGAELVNHLSVVALNCL